MDFRLAPIPGMSRRSAPVPALQFRLVAPEDSTVPADWIPDVAGRRRFRVLRPILLDGSAVARAGLDFTPRGTRSIQVQLTTSGAQRFAEITATNIDRQLAIVFREKVLTAPIIRTKISGGRMSIEGSFNAELIHSLVDALNHASTPSTRAWSFSAPHERVLSALLPHVAAPGQPLTSPAPERGWLDLDSGVLATNESVDWRTRPGHDWIATNGFDLVAEISSGHLPALTAFDLVVAPAPTNGWDDVAAADVVQDWTLSEMEPRPEQTFGAAPGESHCFLFQTRTGRRGLLEILGLTDDGRAVKLRYKLAQSETRTASRSSSATAAGK